MKLIKQFGLSLVIGGGLLFGLSANQTTAQASTRFIYNKPLTTNPDGRNVTFTTKNALYNKAGILKGAKVIASKSSLATYISDLESRPARAYRIAQTNTGSVYYKVVTFSGTYRGWIYGGKKANKFSGGLTSYATTQPATLPSSNTKFKGMNLATATSNDVFWTAPIGASYKASRDTSITNVNQYQDTTFTISRAVKVTSTKETWYQISSDVSALNSKWIDKNDAVPIN